MATQITHIVLADKAYKAHFAHHSRRDFLIGTIFPDIRFLGSIPRDATHVYDLTLADILAEPNAFRAGLLLHSLVDVVREDFVTREGVYDLLPSLHKQYTIPKLLEDELFYRHLADWPEVIRYLDAILPEEYAYGVPLAHITKWHTNLQDYFKAPPTDATRQVHAIDLGVQPENVADINRTLATLRAQPRATEIAHAFYDTFDELMTAWKGRPRAV